MDKESIKKVVEGFVPEIDGKISIKVDKDLLQYDKVFIKDNLLCGMYKSEDKNIKVEATGFIPIENINYIEVVKTEIK